MIKTNRHKISKDIKSRVFAKSNNICYLCGLFLSPFDFNIDHVNPISKGGKNTLKNMKATHKKCNELKGNKII
jgi:5-methylcytosine-specific restriction endonuclease McrA